MGALICEIADNFTAAGKVEWISFRPGHRKPVTVVQSARLIAHRGIEGDHKAVTGGGRRQVTLLQYENLATIAQLAGVPEVRKEDLRRNIVISGINLCALIGKYFRINDAVLQGTGHCHPCARMEEALGRGGYNVMRGYGGINAIVCEAGEVLVGSKVIADVTIRPS